MSHREIEGDFQAVHEENGTCAVIECGEVVFRLRGGAFDCPSELQSALRAYKAGLEHGRSRGEAEAQMRMRRALGL